MLTFVNYRRESLIYLEKIDNELHRLVYGLEKLTNGQLSTAIIPARLLHKFLHKILREVRIQHPQFVPLYTELHHYYESSMNSYSNDKEHIFIQIPIYFVAANQKPMDLFRIHTVPVPLDIDTYQGKESKYTTLELQYKYLATNGHEYMDVTDAALDSCNTYHMDHLCENLHVTTDVKELNCAIAIYMDSVETSSHSAKHIQNIIKTKCRFIYHEDLHPTPTTLQTQDEILFANFPSENWQLICDEITDRPSFMKGALYTIINLQDLCTCGILTQEGRFLYESMRSCDSPDTEVDLHFTYNRALVSYDNHITAQDSKRYAIKPYPFQAPDLQYYEHMPYMTSNGTLHLRTRRHAPSTNTHQQAIAVQQFPLSEAVHKMETQEPIYVGPILPASFDAEQFQDDIEVPVNTNNPPQENIVVNTMDQPMSNFLFNIITLINTLLHFSMIIFLRISLKPGGMFYNVVLQMVQMSMTKHVTAVRLTDPLLPTPSEKPLLILDSPILEDNQYTTESPKDSLQDISPMISFSKTVTIFIGILFGCIIFWAIFKIFILPLFFKSTMCRQLCISCLHNSQTRRAPVTDIFLDIIHIYSGKQIRLYLTTISAPASALGFTGTVKLKNFKIITRKFQIFVDIDWHNCLLLYNNFIIPLPERGTAVPFQPNLLTDFNLQGPYNIVLLARHLDTMIQIPHLDNQEYMQSEEKLHFPVESPLIKYNLPFSMIIFLRISLKPGGMFYNVVLQMVQMSMTKHVTAVRLKDPLLPTPSEKPLLILDSPILEDNQYTTESPTDSLQDISPMISFSKTVTIFIGILFGCIIFWAIFKIFILPLFFKSTMCRQLCISCLHNSQTRRAPVTDIFLDIIHIYSGKQIRLYLTTISAPASALGFTGTVKLKNFKIITRKFQIFVDIDWHNGLLLYNNFIIPLPERGTAVPFQPNLLTDFNLQGPYNIVLLARHLDTMIQIPHLDNQEYMQSEEKLHFPVESPYKKIHDEVEASSVATSPTSSRDLTDDGLPMFKYFIVHSFGFPT